MLTPAALETLSQAIDRAHEVARMLSGSNIITAGEYTSIASGLHAAWQLHQEYARLLAEHAARIELEKDAP